MADLPRRPGRDTDAVHRGANDGRRASRHDIRFAMSFAILTGERWLATCRNIGLGGAFIETPEPMSVGAGVVVYLPLPEFVEPVRIASTVRWTTSEGFGVQFGVMGVRETRGLMSLIYPS